MKNIKPISFTIGLLVYTSSAIPAEPLKKGYISNDAGDNCWYTQVKKEQNAYFHGTNKGTNWVLTFDDKACMGDSGVGLDVNMMMINNIISKSYSHDDAKFSTRTSEMYPGSLMQEQGRCIQSKTYPMIGITIDYIVEDNSISSVVHGAAIQGCTE